ncbi:MAG: hypothetical protein IPI50_01890 [Saprospiraceae bacterium]|nr:hypothetical protein [Saprospiraceae bacterium]
MNKIFKISFFLSLIILVHFRCTADKRLISTSSASPLEDRQKQIARTLLTRTPILNLLEFDKKDLRNEAADLIIQHESMNEYYFEKGSNKPMLSEIFSVSKMRAADQFGNGKSCESENCFRVEIYHYATNGLIMAVVDMEEKKVLDLSYFAGFQPDIPPHLGELAKWIASHDTAVMRTLGVSISEQNEPRMANTKTALNNTKCQRSQHLCVAPTYVKGDKALWAIIDLTDLKVAGMKWTEVGTTGMAITERLVQNEKMMSCYCEIENQYSKDGWEFNYTLTRSDGLRITDIKYLGNPLFDDVKMVDWHVSYSNTEGFGYSDAIGCPEYSQAAVVAIEPPYFETIIENNDTIGFKMVQKYFSEGWPTPCSYNYQQNFEFYKDGSFRPVVGSLGRGCGNDGTYRPVTRIALSGKKNTFQNFKNSNWQDWKKEQWFLENELTEYSEDRFVGRIISDGKPRLYVEAAKGQFNDGGRGDKAYYYITKRHDNKNEGETDLPTIGPCCNTDHHQGPEKFIESTPEATENTGIVLWYVPQLKNDNSPGAEYCWAESVLENGIYVAKVFPCFSGPKFHLIP